MVLTGKADSESFCAGGARDLQRWRRRLWAVPLVAAAAALHCNVPRPGFVAAYGGCGSRVLPGPSNGFLGWGNTWRPATVPRGVACAAGSDSLEVWRAGPADVYSGPALKALHLMKENPELFESAFESELESLAAQREEDAKNPEPSGDVKSDTLVLRRRVKEVRQNDRLRIATELVYLKVCDSFKKMQVPLIPPLKGGGDIRFGQTNVNLKGLTDIYSIDALALVKDHLMGILGMQGSAVMGVAMVQIALFQAGQVYAMSALFGYYVRRVDARYQLEKLAGMFGNFGEDLDSSSKNPKLEDSLADSLKDYIQSFGPEEMQRMTQIASLEASNSMERQVSALFGDLRVLKDKLLDAVGMVMSNEEATKKLQEAIEANQVESIRITTDDLRRLVLEAVAFGALLYDAEKAADTFYELTPGKGRQFGALTGDDDEGPGGRMLPG